MANINDVAARARVSAMTVSRVLNNTGRVSAATRAAVLQAIKDLNYVPNQLARSLVKGQSRTLALLVTDVTNPFFTTIARGVEDAARRGGYRVLLCNTDEDVGKEQEYLETLIAAQVDGIIIAPAGSGSRKHLQLLIQRGIPAVLVDRALDGVECDQVVGDSEAGARALVQHLLELGHRRVALVTGPLTVSTARDRHAGYRRALAEAGIPLDPGLELETSYKQEGGQQAAAALLALADRPTAVFCANNFQAVGLVVALREAGIQVPEQLAVCCFDDVELASMLDPFLTVAAQPAYSFGTIATQLLLERLGGAAPPVQRRVVLQPNLIVRRSTVGAARPHGARA